MREFSWKMLGAAAAMMAGALSIGCAGSVAEPHYAAAWAVSEPAPASPWQEAAPRLASGRFVSHSVSANAQAIQAKRAHFLRRLHLHAHPKPHHHALVATPH